MAEVEAVKKDSQREQVEAHMLEHGQIYADIWKLGINMALRIGDMLRLTMDDIRKLDPDQPTIRIVEQKTGKARKIVLNKSALAVVQRRLEENPKHKWLFQSEATNLSKRQQQAINRRSVLRVFERVGQSVAPKVKLGTHSMRKTRGFALHQAGQSIEQISKILNHGSPAVTMRYIGLVQQDIDQSYIDLEL